MTETDETVATQEPEAEAEATGAHCRHCGRPSDIDTEAHPDWLCPHCERYQDSVTCPTCHQVANVHLMEPDAVPPPAEPKRK